MKPKWVKIRGLRISIGPAHAIYFATYEAVKNAMGGNSLTEHHPLAAGISMIFRAVIANLTLRIATSGACATIASDALMNPFDGMTRPKIGDEQI